MRDNGELQNDPKDIGPLIREIQADLAKECKDEVADVLIRHFWPQILRGAIRGLPEWYKQSLLAAQFDAKDVDDEKLHSLEATNAL
jgi:hypothetical protein